MRTLSDMRIVLENGEEVIIKKNEFDDLRMANNSVWFVKDERVIALFNLEKVIYIVEA